jgi:hypothetical protein
MMYAFARDGGLPMSEKLRVVDPNLRTPGAAVWVGGILSIIATLYGGAFLVLSTGCAVFLYLSYLLPITAALWSETQGNWKNKGPFNLGGASILVAIAAIIGCGAQARYQLDALKSCFPIEEVRLFDISTALAQAFATTVRTSGFRSTPSSSVAEAVDGADIVVTCTTSKLPVLTSEMKLKGCFVAAVGADDREGESGVVALGG